MSVINLSNLQQLIENTSHWDKDERYMATNDLCNILSRDVKIDENMEQKICTAVLKQLDDQSNDVQSVAVKCLAVLVKKVHQNQISEISKKLCSLVVDGNDALRDIYSIGLKTLIADVPDNMGPLVCERLTVKLTQGIGRSSSEEIKRECLDLMTDLLKRFGQFNESEHANIMSAVFEQLRSEKTVIRKRAALCLGALAVVSSDNLLNDLITALLDRIHELEKTARRGQTSQESRTLIQTIGTISRTVGYRLGRHLPRIIPLFLQFLGDPEDESLQNDASNELRESCFPGLESFVLRCPKEVVPFIGEIIKVSVEFMKYDPNYAYDEDEDNTMDVSDADGEDEEEYDEEDYGEDADDDSSWKVRKSAVRVITAIVTAHPQLLKDLYNTCADELIKRFKEREENVRLDIIHCFAKFVETNYVFSQRAAEKHHSSSSSAARSTSRSLSLEEGPPLVRQNSAQGLLESRLDAVIAASYTQLRSPSIKTKSAILTLLQTLLVTLNGGLDRHFLKLATISEKCLHDKNQGLKLDTLQFLRLSFTHLSPMVVQPCLGRLLPPIIKIVSEDWYKTIAEALRVLNAIITAMRPWEEDLHQFDESFDYQALIQPIYRAILTRLETVDIDFEIKECAIRSIGTLLSQCGDHLTDQLPAIIQLFRKRLENETTRTVTLKAVSMIAASHLPLQLNDFLASTAEELSNYLRQYNRSLKQQTLVTLDGLVSHSSTVITEAIATVIVKESAVLLVDTDLHLCHLSIKLVHSLLKKNATVSAEAVAQYSYQRLITLAKSPLLQGHALHSLLIVLPALIQTGDARFAFDTVFRDLYSLPANATGKEYSRQSLSNLSKSIAGICASLPEKTFHQTISLCAKDISSEDDLRAQLALLSIGEAGQQADLSHHAELKDLILACFDRSHEDVKFAAAYALGHIAVGGMNTFLPLVLQSIHSSSQQTRQQYLLLMSLKETITIFANNGLPFDHYLASILPILLEQNKSEEESIRNIVGDCFGILTTISPQQILPVLLDLYQREHENKLSLRTIANAFKSALARHLSPTTSQAIHEVIETILPLLRDEDLDVKKAAILMINTAAHHNPLIVHHYIIGHVNPLLYETLQIKLERIVDLGPFKHKVDDNLLLRKISLTCLDTILTTMPDRFDANGLMAIAALLLTDNDEVKSLFLQILPRICELTPAAIVIKVDEVIPPLEKILEKGNKEGDSAAEKGYRELLKATVRAMLAINKIEDVRVVSRKWNEFMERSRKMPKTEELFHALENETLDLQH